MADTEQQTDEAPDTAALEREASALGWQPKDRFRGDPEKWTDAETYLKRGKEMLPILRATNKRLEGEVASTKAKLAETTSALEELRGSIAEMSELQVSMMEGQLARQRADIKAKLRDARKEENDAALDALEEELEAVEDAQKDVKERKTALEKTPATKKPDAVPKPTPEYEAWIAENPWTSGSSVEDKRRQRMAVVLGKELGEQGLRGKAFFDKLDEELAEAFPTTKRRGAGKTEDGAPSGGAGSSSSSSEKSYRDLPADAKAVCDAEEKRFVGANKAFKDQAAWRKHYAKSFFAYQ